MIGVFAGLGALILAMSTIPDGDGLKRVGSTIIAVSVAMGILAGVLYLFDKIISGGGAIEAAMGVMVALMLGIAGLILAMGTIKVEKIRGLGAIFGMLAVVFSSVVVLTLLAGDGRLKEAAQSVVGVLIALGLVLVAAGKVFNKEKTWQDVASHAVSVIGAIAAIYAISQALNTLRGLSLTGDILPAVIGMGAVMAEIGILMFAISKMEGLDREKIVALLGAVLALSVVAGALYFLADKNLGQLAVGAVMLGVIFAELAIALGVLSNVGGNLIETAAALTLVSAGIAALALGLSVLAKVPADGITVAAVAMGILFAVLAVAVGILGSILGVIPLAGTVIAAFAGVIVAVGVLFVAASASFYIFIAALKLLNEFLPSFGANLATFVTTLASVVDMSLIAGLVALAFALGSLVIPLGLFAVAGIALIPGSVGFTMFAESLTVLIDPLSHLIALPILDLVGTLVSLGVIFGAFGLFAGALMAGSAAITALAMSLNALTPAASGLVGVDITSLAVGLLKIGAAAAIVGAASPLIISASVAFTMLSGSLAVLSATIVGLLTSLNIVSRFLDGLRVAGSRMAEIGKWFVESFIQGVQSLAKRAYEVAKNIGERLESGLRNALGIHSLSPKLFDIGEWLVKSPCAGAESLSGLAEMTGFSIGDGMAGGLVDAIKSGGAEAFAALQSFVSSANASVGSLNLGFDDYMRKMKNNQFADKMKGYTQTMDEYGDIIYTAKENTDQATDSIFDMDEAFANLAGEGGGGGGGSVKKAGKEIEDLSKTIYDKVKGSIDVFGEFSMKTEMTKDKLLKNMQSQLDGIASWSAKLAELGQKGVSEGLLKYLAELGPQGYEYVNAFSTMTLEEIQRANQMYTAQLMMPAAATTQIKGSFAQAGIDVGDGFLKAMAEEGLKWPAAAKDLAEDTIDGLKDGFDSHSPSRKSMLEGQNLILGLTKGLQTYNPQLIARIQQVCTMAINRFKTELNQTKFLTIGRNVIQGIINGIDSRYRLLLDKCVSVAQAVIAQFKEAFKSENLEPIGASIVDGIVKGIDSNAHKARESARKLASEISNTINSSLKINSPSKVSMKSGEGVVEGLVLGMMNMRSELVNASEETADAAIDSLRGIINDIYYGFDDMADISPVIKPVLDLSNVQAGASNMQRMLSDREIALNNLNASLTGTDGNTGSPGNSFSFVQNNYSPKALSRIDIYRDTRNQLSMMKRMVQST